MHRSVGCFAALLLVSLLTLSIAGCGGSPDQDSASDANSEQTAAKERPTSPQAVVVDRFLQAAIQGDREGARRMLTTLSVQKIDEFNLPFMAFAIDGSFQLGKTVQREDACFVQCIWTDQDAAGEPRSESLQWMLKKETEKDWRIFGVAYYTAGDSKAQIINFEQPEEIVRRQQAAEQEAAAAASQQANRPQDPFQSAPR